MNNPGQSITWTIDPLRDDHGAVLGYAWEVEVHRGDGNKRVAKGQRAWLWTARRAVRKVIRSATKGPLP